MLHRAWLVLRHRGVVDAVEGVGEDGHGDRQADVRQLRVGVAGGLNRRERLVADGAAGLRQSPGEANQSIALGITHGLRRISILLMLQNISKLTSAS
jgi:hypothetical protein